MINPLPLVKILAALAILLLVLAGLWYVTGLRADLAISQDNAKKLEDAVNTQKETIDQQRADAAAVVEANQAMSRLIEKQNKQ